MGVVQTDQKFFEEYVTLEVDTDLEHDIRLPGCLTIEVKVLDPYGDTLTDWKILARGPAQDYAYIQSDAQRRLVLAP